MENVWDFLSGVLLRIEHQLELDEVAGGSFIG